jgi:methionyl-tRNA formyltransferase
VHGGLSPWYRGAITHFWPSYMLEPEYTGMTLHELTSNIDGGNIIHQTISELNSNDGIHQNACRVVKAFSDELPALLNNNLKQNKKINSIKQVSTGRIWTKKMWSPLNLKIIYDLYNDQINKYCLENKKIVKPKIDSVFI